MKSKKVIITGGSGFIGANLARKLIEQGHKTTLISRKGSNLWRLNDVIKNLHIVNLDLLDGESVKNCVTKIKPDIVYHLATYGAYSYQNEADKIFLTNIFGTLNLLNACKEVDLELFINTGSSSEYGFKKTLMKEDDILVPNSFYAIAKAAQTHLTTYYTKTYNLPAVTLRPFSVYGPYEEPSRLIPNMMAAFYNNSQLKMVSKKVVRDFIYIDDYIEACLNIENLKKFPGETFNIGSGIQTNFGDLIKTFQKVTGTKIKIAWGSLNEKEWDSKFWQADTSKTIKFLKFKPKNSLEDGLQKSWKWYGSHHFIYDQNN